MCESVEVFFGACVSLRYRLSSAAVYLQEENNFTLKLRVRKNTDGGGDGGGCCSNFCPQFKKYAISFFGEKFPSFTFSEFREGWF